MTELIPALQVAALAVRTAKEQLPALQAHQKRCTLLVSRSESLLEEVSRQYKLDQSSLVQRHLLSLESVCATVRDAIVDLASKGLAWRLIHQDRCEKLICVAEGQLTDAFFIFHVGTHITLGEIQSDIAEASKIDQQHFISYLENISETDQKIIDALRSQNLRLEETLMALTKHCQARKSRSSSDALSERFVRRAVSVLQRVSVASSHEVFPWQITSLEVEYERTETNMLGSGGFGKVFKGQWQGEIIALKEMHKSVFGEARNERKLRAFETEIKIWLRLNHPRILPFYGACLASEKPFLVMKYCPNGNVMDYMREFPEINRLLILHEIASGMVYLHDQSIIHADLKAANILIGDDHKALICDFGLSHLKDQTTSTLTTPTIQGTLNYMAPEYLDGAPLDYPADIYSYAMTAWQIYTGLTPFNDVPQRAFQHVLIDRDERPEYPTSMSSPVWAMVQECWQREPNDRPTFSEVEATLKPLVDPFMKKRRRQSLPLTQMLAFSQVPTPPESVASGSQAEIVQIKRLSMHSPSSDLHPTSPTTKDEDWQQAEGQPSLQIVVSPNSIDFFNKTLVFLGETQSLEKYQNVALLSYPNWLKYHPYNTKSPRPQHILKNRVKASLKKFNQALLEWVDYIPNLKNANIKNVHRATLLLAGKFYFGTCAMAEYTYRKNSKAPQQHVQEFIDNSIKVNAFRALVEKSVAEAMGQYEVDADINTLSLNLARGMNQVCP